MNRRGFFTHAATGALGAGLGALVVPRWTLAAPPSEQIVTGHIGVGGMGGGHVDWFLGCPNVRVVALCDVDQGRLSGQVKKVQDRYKNTEATGYRDFRQVLDRTDIDAISTATPDHWRAMIVTHAFMSGKDVYAEKPLCHNYLEAQAMLRLGQRYQRVYQLGTQIHAGDNYHRVVELVRSGILGKIHTLRAHARRRGARGLRLRAVARPRPLAALRSGAHPLPLPLLPRFLLRPLRRLLVPHQRHRLLGRRHPDHAQVHHGARRASDPGHLRRSTPQTPENCGWGMACTFYGTEGALTCNYGERWVFLRGEKLRDVESVPKTLPRSPGHHVNFLECVKTRALTESNLPYAVNMTTPMFFGRISLLLGGRTLHWDESRKQFAGDDEANRLLGRVYRQPWTLPA